MDNPDCNEIFVKYCKHSTISHLSENLILDHIYILIDKSGLLYRFITQYLAHIFNNAFAYP